MNPVAILLLGMGYLIVVPIATRMSRVVSTQNRLAMTAHQMGIGVVCLGWIAGSRAPIIWPHILWAIASIIWFNWHAGRRPKA